MRFFLLICPKVNSPINIKRNIKKILSYFLFYAFSSSNNFLQTWEREVGGRMSDESGPAAERTIGEAKLQYQAITKWNKHVPLDVDEFRNLSSLVEMTQILELTYVWHESHYIVSGLNEVLNFPNCFLFNEKS